jgi:serine/threonine protein kinase
MKMNLEVSEYIYILIFNNSFFFKDFLIGYGAFGVIWAVTDPRTSRRVALKKMPNVFQSVVAARRAFREIKMLCTFRHDNVIEYI